MSVSSDISVDQLKCYDVRPVSSRLGHSQIALVCRACDGTVLVDDTLRVDVILGAIASGVSLAGHCDTCPLRDD